MQTAPNRKEEAETPKKNYKLAAPLGLVVLCLALVGVISLISSGAKLLAKLNDDSAQRAEIVAAVSLVVGMDPVPFDSVENAAGDFVISATMWQAINSYSAQGGVYTTNESGELVIPKSDAEVAFRQLFGPEHTLPEPTGSGVGELRYSAENNSYLMPISALVSVASPEIPEDAKIREEDGVYTVPIRYVTTDASSLNVGGTSGETTSAADYKTLIYRLGKSESGYYIISVQEDAD